MDAPKLAGDRTLCHDCNHEATEIAPCALFDLAGESQAEPRPRSPRPPDLSRAPLQHAGCGSLQAVNISTGVFSVRTRIPERAGRNQVIVATVPVIEVHEAQRIRSWCFEISRRERRPRKFRRLWRRGVCEYISGRGPRVS